jgi:hypothetical protein
MTLQNDDIKLFYSGGGSNNDPDSSIGGAISNYVLSSNRIFDNVSAAQNTAGYTDYRCVYFNNINSTDTLLNAGIYVDSQVSGGASITIGIEVNNDRQDIYIANAGSVSSGTVTLQFYDFFTDANIQFSFAHDLNISIWASNFQTSIRSISGLEQVTISGSYLGTTAYFSVNFIGTSSKRYFESLEVVSLSQSFVDVNATFTLQKVFDGGPKLKTATEIASEINAPNNITFVETSSSSPLLIGNLKPTEYLPVWIKRTVVAGVNSMENDGFSLKIKGEII